MNINDELHPIRLAIESVTNFLKKQPGTKTTKLADKSKPEYPDDPLKVDLNQMDGPTGSDSTKPKVSVKAGVSKGGQTPTTGQRKANFHQKTELAEQNTVVSNKIRQYIITVLEEQFDSMAKEEASIKEAVDELLGEPADDNIESEDVEEGMTRNISNGRGVNAKPKNYPKNLTRQRK